MKNAPVIRVVKKVQVHEASHGGSWKVAYADFVTAMMAFFLVMWIISMDQPVREQIQNYFNNPFSASTSRAGISQIADGGKSPVGRGFGGVIDDPGWRQVSFDAQRDRMRLLQIELLREIALHQDLAGLSRNLKLRTTENGLAIDLIQGETVSFFEPGSAVPPKSSRKLMAMIARELGRLPQPIVIEGHTDITPYRGKSDYTNWELSTDRANAVRRVMEAAGLRRGQVVQVSGYGPTRLRDPKHPTAAVNRRVTLLVACVPPPASGTGNRKRGRLLFGQSVEEALGTLR